MLPATSATPALEVFADHYNRGITNGLGTWSKSAKATRAHAAGLFAGAQPQRLDLLIIDEGHQLRSSWNARARAIKALFGENGPIPVERVLLLTATPFQLRAAPELERLVKLLRFPAAHGAVDFAPEVQQRLGATALQRLFDGYREAFTHWLRQASLGAPAEQAHARALEHKRRVESLLRELMVRTDVGREHIHVRYGQLGERAGAELPLTTAGLEVSNPSERVLFLAWDGSIASRTTFVATEQQTLTSSVRALLGRDPGSISGRSAADHARRALAPARVQAALAELTKAVAETIPGNQDHCKVSATVEAVAERLERDPDRRPVLVFAERTLTLQRIKRALQSRLAEGVRAEIIDGSTHSERRQEIVGGFQANDELPRVHALLASKVAEMGLDIDGPADKDDIWLIHHDFPWNPAMIEQRNGRVTRPAKQRDVEPAPVWVFYPFLRDTVDERIFKRMLARQAFAEVLLGTDDAVRALGLTVQENLEKLRADAFGDLRELTPNLAPDAPLVELVPAAEPAPMAASPGRPAWCPLELVTLVEGMARDPMTEQLDAKLESLARDEGFMSWTEDAVRYLHVDLDGRRQVVALRESGDVVEAVSLAAAVFDLQQAEHALRANVEPGVAALVPALEPGRSAKLYARAANLLATLSMTELQTMIMDTARRADEWEREYFEEDQW